MSFSKKILCVHLMFCRTFSEALIVYTFYYLTKQMLNYRWVVVSICYILIYRLHWLLSLRQRPKLYGRCVLINVPVCVGGSTDGDSVAVAEQRNSIRYIIVYVYIIYIYRLLSDRTKYILYIDPIGFGNGRVAFSFITERSFHVFFLPSEFTDVYTSGWDGRG